VVRRGPPWSAARRRGPLPWLASAALVALGLPRADPLLGLAITAVILKITWDSWQTIYGQHPHA